MYVYIYIYVYLISMTFDNILFDVILDQYLPQYNSSTIFHLQITSQIMLQ